MRSCYFITFTILLLFTLACSGQEEKIVNHPFLKGNRILPNINTEKFYNSPTMLKIYPPISLKDFFFQDVSELDSFVHDKFSDSIFLSFEPNRFQGKKAFFKQGKIMSLFDGHEILYYYDNEGNVLQRLFVDIKSKRILYLESFKWNSNKSKCTVSRYKVKSLDNDYNFLKRQSIINTDMFEFKELVQKQIYTHNKNENIDYKIKNGTSFIDYYSINFIKPDSTSQISCIYSSNEHESYTTAIVNVYHYSDSIKTQTMYRILNPKEFFTKINNASSPSAYIDFNQTNSYKKLLENRIRIDETGKEIGVIKENHSDSSYRYIYDNQGNWIAKIGYFEDNTGHVDFELREFEY